MDKKIIINDIVLHYLDAMRKSNSLAELQHHDSNLCAALVALRKVGMIDVETMKDYDRISADAYISTSATIRARTA